MIQIRRTFAGLLTATVLVAGLFSRTVTAAPVLYWTEFGAPGTGDAMKASNTDGTGIVTIVPNLDNPFGLAYDPGTARIYFSESGAGKIRRVNANGTGLTDLVTGLGSGSRLSIALNLVLQTMYWTNADLSRIERAALTGGAVTQINAGQANYPDGIAVDPAAGKIYWGEQLGSVKRANLDGTSPQTLFTPPSFADILLDLPANRMYISEPNANRIARADLDGTNVQTVVSTGDRPFGLAIDKATDTIYWTDLDGGRIRKATLSTGANIQTIVSGLSSPRDLMLLPEPAGTVIVLVGTSIVALGRRLR